jgi:hypothetical protein
LHKQPVDSTRALPRLTLRVICVSRIPFLLAWLPAIVGILYLKFVSLQFNEFFDFRLRTLPLLQELSLFRNDILLCFVLVPLALFLFTLVLPQRLCGPFVALFSIVWLLISYGNRRSIAEIGRLYSSNLLWDSLHWAWSDPRVIREYIKLDGAIRVLVLIALTAAISWWTRRQSAACLKQTSTRRRWVTATRVAALTLVALTVLPWLSRVPLSPATQSIMISSIHAFWGWEVEERSAKLPRLSSAELIAKYRELAHIEASTKDQRYWSRAEDSDVIVFVFETGPAELLPIDGNLDDFPNLRMLRDRAFVAPKHYTTYPFTSRALFSAFSSWYPSAFTKDFTDTFSDLEVPGIARKLSSCGYKTVYYSPSPWRRDYDVSMPRALGFVGLYFAHRADDDSRPWMAKRSEDLDSLHMLESDVEAWLSEGQRYMAVFAPQLSHSPWFDVTPDGRLKNVMERGRPLMALQDAYLGEIVKLLNAHHRLDKTLIVVVGDHGLRTRDEDPDLALGMLDDISFHVPMLVYAPQVLKASVTIPWLTSHVDISPTLLDLMGIDRQRDLEQGSPVWDAHLQERTTFLFARHLFNADGYHAHDGFVMWNTFFDMVYANSHLHFGAANAVSSTSPVYRQATDSIQRMVTLQQRWVEEFGRGDRSARVTAKR